MEQPQRNSGSLPYETDGSWSVKCVDKVTKIFDWEITVCSPTDSTVEPVSLRSPTFWHSHSTMWCMEIMKTSGKLYPLFNLLSSHIIQPTQAELMVSVEWRTTELKKRIGTNSVTLVKPQRFEFSFDADNFPTGCKFRIRGEITIVSEILEANMSGSLNTHLRSRTDDLGTLHKRLLSVTDDLWALLASADLSDVVLCVGGTELRAHRALLSARSPVFAAMFRHDTKEAHKGRVDIEDVEPDTMQEVLRYIYTGMVCHIEGMADRLLVAADKYGLTELKDMCERELVCSLNVDNAADSAVIAMRHSCNLLKKSVIHFIKKNLVAVMGSDGWSDAIRQEPDVIMKISRLIADKF